MLENCTSEIIQFGMWQSEGEVNRHVHEFKTKILKMRTL